MAGIPHNLDSLACLPDVKGSEAPPYPLHTILRCAILGSPNQRLLVQEIYIAMEEKFPYYRTAGVDWKHSVRHQLSLHRLFVRQRRSLDDPGRGSYWTINLQTPQGNKRLRKRGSKRSRPLNNATGDLVKSLYSQKRRVSSIRDELIERLRFKTEELKCQLAAINSANVAIARQIVEETLKTTQAKAALEFYKTILTEECRCRIFTMPAQTD
ncbi:hypothetical protein B0H14DRAFT_2702324 [Mycena olivaceomarginata]|nr:hypothetical protein B0H14DRAFT_2702324 [Mycena olivaceomarginata]